MFCTNCGKQYDDGAFCPHCGAAQAPVQQPTPEPVAAAASPVAKPKGKLPISAIVALIGAIVLLLSTFLPYMSANKDYAKILDATGSAIALPGTDLTAKDLKDVSLLEFATIANALAEMGSSDSGYEIVAAMVYILVGLAVVVALFAYFKKPVAVIIFSLLSYGLTMFFELGITESGALNTKVYDFGIAHTLIPLAVVACIVGAIWMIVDKKKAKNVQNTAV